MKPHFTLALMDPYLAPDSLSATEELRTAAMLALCETEPGRKVAAVYALRERWQARAIGLDRAVVLHAVGSIPGRPGKPALVPPLAVPRRAMHTVEGRAALVHALAHIEFNAINLALDAVWRFPALPEQFYDDWLRVAAEEALHFSLLAEHLGRLGYRYGDFPAHNSLWEMADRTGEDVLARIALVPRTLEARGLDASPAVRAKLAQAGDAEAAQILDIILRDEIGHVAVGNHWYGWLCQQNGLEPVATYAVLAARYRAPALRGPFNLDARRMAGFTEPELAALVG